MALHSLTPNLMVEDVAATVEWYESALDATVLAAMSATALEEGVDDQTDAEVTDEADAEVTDEATGEANDEATGDSLTEVTDDAVWAQVAVDDVEFMFQRRDSLEEELPTIEGSPIGGSFTMYIDVDDVDALSDRLADEPRPLGMRTTSYGRQEFAIEDPNGYVLWFGEKVDG